LFCYTQKSDGHNRVVVNLLAPPKASKAGDNKFGETPKISNVAVAYNGPGKVTKAWELSPFITGFAREIPCTKNSVKPNDFYLWTIVVLELEGGGK